MMSIVVGALAGLVGGGAIVFAVVNAAMKKRSSGILKEAELQAEALKKEKIVQAKEKFLQLKDEHEREARERDDAHADQKLARERTASERPQTREPISHSLHHGFPPSVDSVRRSYPKPPIANKGDWRAPLRVARCERRAPPRPRMSE